MYDLIRGLMAFLVMAICFYLLRHRMTRKLFIVLIVFTIVITFLFKFFPIENMFYTFPSPEAAYRYVSGKQDTIITVSGKNSTLTIGNNEHIIFPKTNKGWKVMPDVSTKMVDTYLNPQATVTLWKLSGTEEYYITIIMPFQGTAFELIDRDHTEFKCFYDGIEYSQRVYYGYVPHVDQNYYFHINNKIIYPFQCQGDGSVDNF